MGHFGASRGSEGRWKDIAAGLEGRTAKVSEDWPFSARALTRSMMAHIYHLHEKVDETERQKY